MASWYFTLGKGKADLTIKASSLQASWEMYTKSGQPLSLSNGVKLDYSVKLELFSVYRTWTHSWQQWSNTHMHSGYERPWTKLTSLQTALVRQDITISSTPHQVWIEVYRILIPKNCSPLSEKDADLYTSSPSPALLLNELSVQVQSSFSEMHEIERAWSWG